MKIIPKKVKSVLPSLLTWKRLPPSPWGAADKPSLKFYGAQHNISLFTYSILGEGKNQELNQVNTSPGKGKDPELNSGPGNGDPKRSVAAIVSDKETLEDNSDDTCFQVGMKFCTTSKNIDTQLLVKKHFQS